MVGQPGFVRVLLPWRAPWWLFEYVYETRYQRPAANRCSLPAAHGIADRACVNVEAAELRVRPAAWTPPALPREC
jgi:hypothetical protein